MKKKFLITLSLSTILVSLLGSCSNNNNKICVYKYEDIDSFVYLEKDELLSLISTSQNFILVVGEEGCSSCEYIKDPYIDYIKKYHNIVYWVETPTYLEVSKALENDDNYYLSPGITSATTLIFENGKNIKTIPYDSNLYFSDTKLDSTLSSYVSNRGTYLINDLDVYKYNANVSMYKINLQTQNKLNETIASSNQVKILYSWKNCGDCKEFKVNYLNNFFKNNNIKLYEYDVHYLRSQDDLTNFKKFADEVGLSSYREGKVPSIITYENSSKVDMIVYSNDVIKKENEMYVTKESFFPSLVSLSDQDITSLHNKLIEAEWKMIEEYLKK